MDLHQIESFVTAAELQSFTRAAQQLSVTQSAVSQHIAAIEKELRVALFERTGRAVVPTADGRVFYQFARQILDLVAKARETLGGVAPQLTGEVRIAASTVPAEALLPELLAEFRLAHPEIHESVAISDSVAATLAVESGNADVGIVGEFPRSPRLCARAVADDELVPVVGPGHPLAASKRVAVGQLQEEPFIVREVGSGSRHCVEQALEQAGCEASSLRIAMEMNSNEAIRQAVARGTGIAFLSLTFVQRDLDDGRLVRIDLRGVRPQRSLYLITDSERLPTLAVRAFLGFAERHFRK